MTLESTINQNRYIGNGATTVFPFTFKVWKTDQVAVFVGNGIVEQEVSASCTVEITPSGGTVTFQSAPEAGRIIVIQRSMPFVQEDDYRNGTRFDSEEIEDRFDQDCAERQDLRLDIGRALKSPFTSNKTADEMWQDLVGMVGDVEQAKDLIWQWLQAIGTDHVGNAALVMADGSTAWRALASRFADVVNVKDYGAKGDGVTNDLNAFVAASATGKNVFVPDGDYKIAPGAGSVVSAISACRRLTGFGDVELAVPQGIHDISSATLECEGGVSVVIKGQVERITISSGAVTFTGSAGYYVATIAVPDGTKFSIGMPITLNQTSNYASLGAILNGTFRVLSVSGNNISFPVHYHEAAYSVSGLNWSGVIIIYKTAFKHTGTSTCFLVDTKCKNFEINNIGIIGKHSYNASYGDTVGIKIEGGCSLSTFGATEFGVGVLVRNSNANISEIGVANSEYAVRCMDFADVHVTGFIACCLSKKDGLSIDHSSALVSYCACFLSGNIKRGLWCNADSSFFCEEPVYTCYNAQAGIYAKSNSSVWVGQGSEASYNYETDANDCPGYGCESDSLIMAYGTAARYNGVGYSPGNGAAIDAQYSTADSNVNTNYYALVGGVIEAAHSVCIGSQYGYSAGEGSVVRCKDAEVYGATVAGLVASRCSEIRADRISIHDNAVGLRANSFADIYAPEATLADNEADYRSGRNSVIYAGSSLYPTYFTPGEGELYPWADNAQQLGLASLRWSNVFAATGSVQTSDRRSKTSITEPSEALMRAWGKVNFKVFQFIDAVEKKGSSIARLHVGVIAQDVQEAFAEEGLDAARYGLFCFDRWDDVYETVELDDGTETKTLLREAGDLYGVRYEEALALECAYQRWRLEQIEARLASLEVQ